MGVQTHCPRDRYWGWAGRGFIFPLWYLVGGHMGSLGGFDYIIQMK